MNKKRTNKKTPTSKKRKPIKVEIITVNKPPTQKQIEARQKVADAIYELAVKVFGEKQRRRNNKQN